MSRSTQPIVAPVSAAAIGDAATSPAPRGGPWRRLTRALTLLVSSIAILALITCAFCPRFVLWSGLHVPEAWPYPEVNRAVPSLEQTRRPFTDIPQVVATIRWRLLMPLVAYVTGMPDWLFLALPHIGCVIALAFVMHLTHRATGSWRRAAAAGAVVGASPWLFTSMGWLAYFDSWLMLALLVASFVRSRVALAIAYVLTPWVDERIIVAAPICLLVRAVYLYRDVPRPLRETVVDAAVIAIPVLPYVLARLLLIRGTDQDSAYYVSSTWQMMRAVPLTRYLAGLWFAHRAAWFFIAAFVVFVWAGTGGRLVRVGGTVIVLATTAASLLIAGDLTRSLAVLMPACLAAMLLLWERRRRLADRAVAVVLLLSFLLPAQHVVSLFVVPIRSLLHEVRAWRHPPDEVNARAHLQVAVVALREGRPHAALHFVDNALTLDDSVWTSPDASLGARELAAARQVVDAVLAAQPREPHALLLRARFHLRHGNEEAARSDLRRALDAAPADWSKRAEAERRLAR